MDSMKGLCKAPPLVVLDSLGGLDSREGLVGQIGWTSCVGWTCRVGRCAVPCHLDSWIDQVWDEGKEKSGNSPMTFSGTVPCPMFTEQSNVIE